MIDKDEVLLSKEVGLRLAQARKLSDQYRFSQQMAAELLGISAGDLRLMEEGLKLVPLTVIVATARAFDVSCEWLLGLAVDDWERSEESRKERNFLVGLERLHIENHAKAVAKQLEQDAMLFALSDAVALLAPAIQAVDDAFMGFWLKNAGFEDMPGGASVLNRIDQAQAAARAAMLSLVRAKALPIGSLAALPQPKLALRVWKNPAPAQLPPPAIPISDHEPRTRKRNRAPVKSERQSPQSAALAAS